MNAFALRRHKLPVVPAGSTPVISSFGIAGIKREGESVWLSVEDDGTANKYKFDIQASGVSLTGVAIDDNLSSSVTNFAYVTSSPAITFVVPASLVGVPYTVTGYASSDGGATWSAGVTADEFFGSTQGVYFTPATMSAPTVTRLTGSGVVPPQFQFDGVFYDSDLLRIYHYDTTNTLLEVSSAPLSEAALATPFTLDLSGATDPAPYPALSTTASTDYFSFKITSGDYEVTEGDVGISGVASPAVTVQVNDALTSMVWSGADKTAGITLSGGNLTAAQGGGWGTARGARPFGFNKVYFEVTPDSAITEIGVCDGSVSLPSGSTAYWGNTGFGQVATNEAVGWQGNDSQLYYNNSFTGIGSFSASAVIGVAFDRTTETIWVRSGSGSWLPSGNPATGTGGLIASGLDGTTGYYPFVQVANGHSATANFGTTPGGTTGFTNTPPSGFVAP